MPGNAAGDIHFMTLVSAEHFPRAELVCGYAHAGKEYFKELRSAPIPAAKAGDGIL